MNPLNNTGLSFPSTTQPQVDDRLRRFKMLAAALGYGSSAVNFRPGVPQASPISTPIDPTSAPNTWASMITSLAPQYNVDPKAALAVAKTEGLSGAVGDNGSSFGPFQLHVGGALPAGKDRAWAESPEGIQYALQRIGQVAGGQTGQQAVSSIVQNFERPADPMSEIKRALAYYGGQ